MIDNIADESDSNEITELTAAYSDKSNLLPLRSKEVYELAYKRFIVWCKMKKIQNYSEDVLLEYFAEKSKLSKSPTLWTTFSMLKASLALNDNVDMGKFTKLKSFLKSQSDGYQGKQFKMLAREDMNKFIAEAPDDRFLMMKVALIMGIAGACRRYELTHLTIDNIQDMEVAVVVKIVEEKTKKARTFAIANEKGHPVNFLGIYRRYAALRPETVTHSRFFLKYNNGKCSSQVVGVNTIGKIPYHIAVYLNLPNAADYTGHCFRMSSATMLVANKVVKRHKVWPTATVSEDILNALMLNRAVKASCTSCNGNEICPDLSGNCIATEAQLQHNSDPLQLTQVADNSDMSDTDMLENDNTSYFEDVDFKSMMLKEEHVSDQDTCDIVDIDSSDNASISNRDEIPGTSSQNQAYVKDDLNLETQKSYPNNPKTVYYEEKLNCLRRQTIAAEKLTNEIKKNYYKEKLKLLEREVLAKEKIAVALMDISQKLSPKTNSY